MGKFLSISIILLSIILGISIIIQYENRVPAEFHFSEIKFDIIDFDFGLIVKGKPKTAIFSFKNTGTHPLLIYKVETSCGCSFPEWPRHPIKPERTGKIKVSYDAKSEGRFFNIIKLICNTEAGFINLSIRGEVANKELHH